MAGEKPSPGPERHSTSTSKHPALETLRVLVQNNTRTLLNLDAKRRTNLENDEGFKAGKLYEFIYQKQRMLVFLNEAEQEIANSIATNRIRVRGDIFGDINLEQAFNDDVEIQLPSAAQKVALLDDESTKMFVTSNTPPPLNKTKETVSDKPVPKVGPTDATVGAQAALAKIAMANRTEAPKKKEDEKKKETFVVTPEIEEAIYELIDIESKRQQKQLDEKNPGKGLKGWAKAILEKIGEQLEQAERDKLPTEGIIMRMIEQYRANSKTAPVLDGFFARVRKKESELGPPKKIALAAKYADHIHDEEERMKDEALGGGTNTLTMERLAIKLRSTSPAIREIGLKQYALIANHELNTYAKNYDPDRATELQALGQLASGLKEIERLSKAELAAFHHQQQHLDRKIVNMRDTERDKYAPVPSADTASRTGKISSKMV